MDFLNGIVSGINDGINYIFGSGSGDLTGTDVLSAAGDASKIFSSSTKTTSSDATRGLLTPPKASPDNTRAGPGIRTTQVASGRPAKVHTLDEKLYSSKPTDPWMYTFRSVVNRSQQAAQG